MQQRYTKAKATSKINTPQAKSKAKAIAIAIPIATAMQVQKATAFASAEKTKLVSRTVTHFGKVASLTNANYFLLPFLECNFALCNLHSSYFRARRKKKAEKSAVSVSL